MRPQVSEEQAKELATLHWGFEGPLEAAPLAGYDDRNVRLRGPDGSCVLKVHNDSDSAEPLFAEAQNALLAHLAAAGLPVPAPLPLADLPAAGSSSSSNSANSGSGLSGGGIKGCARGADGFTLRIEAADGRRHAVRCLTWLPGTLLVDAPQSGELYRQLGALLARVNRSLQGWDWPASDALRRPFDWNLQLLGATYQRVRPDLLALEGVDIPLLDAVVAHFVAATRAASAHLRQCIIHSDANERNVLVHAAAAAAAAGADAPAAPAVGALSAAAATAAAGAASGSTGIISGLIDWGDACWQWLAAEPAIAATYMMLLEHNMAGCCDDANSNNSGSTGRGSSASSSRGSGGQGAAAAGAAAGAGGGRGPLAAAAAVVAGYESQVALLPAERALLRTLCMGRLAQSLSLGARAAVQQPDNREYLLGTQRNGWRLLRMLWGMSDEQFLAAMAPPPPPAAGGGQQ